MEKVKGWDEKEQRMDGKGNGTEGKETRGWKRVASDAQFRR